MRKLSSIIASGLALSLVFGMTAFAAPSPSTEGIDTSKAEIVSEKSMTTEEAKKEINAKAANSTVEEVITVAYKEAEAKQEYEALSDEEKAEAAKTATDLASKVDKENTIAVLSTGTAVKAEVTVPEAYMAASLQDVAKEIAAKSAGTNETVKEDTVEVIAFADVTLPGVDASMIGEGISVTIQIPGFKVESGKTYAFVHLVNGQWKTEKITEMGEGYIVVTLTSLSPVYVSSYTIEKVQAQSTDYAGYGTESALKSDAANQMAGWNYNLSTIGSGSVVVSYPDQSNSKDYEFKVVYFAGGKATQITDYTKASDGIHFTAPSAGAVAVGYRYIGEQGKADDSTSASGAATSPKTAETLPIAGVIVVIAMAGAAVVARRIRYNK